MSQQKPLTLSIVIPAYNEEHHLKACLDAIAKQTVMPDEVIVVDNNSIDATSNVAKSFPFVRMLTESKQGIVFARNLGFDSVKSDLIGRIDSDTILPVNWVERVKEFYGNQAHWDHALTGGGYFYNVALPRVNGWVQGQIAYRIVRLNLGFYSLWGSNMALPAKVWREVKALTCSRNDIHEDVELGIHLNELGYKIAYKENLRVGVYARRIWSERDQLRVALKRWPQTMRVHNRKSWWVSATANALLLAVVIPYGATIDYFASVTGRR